MVNRPKKWTNTTQCNTQKLLGMVLHTRCYECIAGTSGCPKCEGFIQIYSILGMRNYLLNQWWKERGVDLIKVQIASFKWARRYTLCGWLGGCFSNFHGACMVLLVFAYFWVTFPSLRFVRFRVFSHWCSALQPPVTWHMATLRIGENRQLQKFCISHNCSSKNVNQTKTVKLVFALGALAFLVAQVSPSGAAVGWSRGGGGELFGSVPARWLLRGGVSHEDWSGHDPGLPSCCSNGQAWGIAA